MVLVACDQYGLEKVFPGNNLRTSQWLKQWPRFPSQFERNDVQSL